MKSPVAALAFLALFLAGCTNPFGAHYIDRLSGRSPADVAGLIPGTGDPRLVHTDNTQVTALELLEDGYVLIGYSVFVDGVLSDSLALDQGRKLHAATIALGRFDAGTQLQTRPVPFLYGPPAITDIDMPPPVAPPGGPSPGLVATPTYVVPAAGVNAGEVPYALNRYLYDASFWVHREPPVFGAVVTDLPPEMRQQFGRNTGALVRVVVKGSPARKVGLLAGDVIIAINQTPIDNAAAYQVLLPEVAGQQASVHVLRGGKDVAIPVKMSPGAAPHAGSAVPGGQ